MSTANYDQSKLSTIKTYMLIAFIFNIIAIIAFLIGGIWDIYSYAVAQSYLSYLGAYYGSYYASVYADTLSGMLISGIVMLVFGIFALYIFLTRIRKMNNAADTGDVATLKSLNSMLWAILCLIFTGVIPGIMLLVSFGPINDLGKATPPPPPS